MLGADIAVAEFAGQGEGMLQGALHPRRDGHVLARLALAGAAHGVGLDVLLEVGRRQAELLEHRLHHVGVGQGVEQVLGIHFALAEFGGDLRGALQVLGGLLAEVLGDIHRLRLAGAHRGDRALLAEAGEDLVERAAATEQRLQRRAHALLAHQLAVVQFAEGEFAALAVLYQADAGDGGTFVADSAKFLGHGRTPVSTEGGLRRRQRRPGSPSAAWRTSRQGGEARAVEHATRDMSVR